MSSNVKQNTLKLAWGVHRGPKDAPRMLVISCLRFEDKACNVALAVSMQAGHHKQAYVAACIGKHFTYVSKLATGERRITEDLVGPLCAATGSNLLKQVWDTVAAMNADDEAREVERLAAMLREAA